MEAVLVLLAVAILFTGDMLLALFGRALLRTVSLGRWEAESFSRNESSTLVPACALSFVRDGRRVFTHTGQLFAGIAFFVLIAFLGVIYVSVV